jgi:hypothetical protein
VSASGFVFFAVLNEIARLAGNAASSNIKYVLLLYVMFRYENTDVFFWHEYTLVENDANNITHFSKEIHSFSSPSYDRSKASSKASSLHSAI